MPFTQEVAEHLKEWGLTPEEMAQLEPILGKPERQEKFKGGVLRQGDYTKKTQELAAERQRLETSLAAKEKIVADDAAALGTWKQTADQEMAANARALEDERVKAFRLEQKLKAMGVDLKDLNIEETPPPPKKDDPPPVDKRYLSLDDANKIVQEVKSNPFIAAELEDIVDEHRTMFGKGLNRKELVTNALKNKRTLREEWEMVNEVAKKRQELNEAAINQRIEARVAEERTKILSENKLPVTRGGDGGGSPILAMRESLVLNGTDRNKPTHEAGAVEAAVSAFNTGKYRGAAPVGAKTA